jgi:hypothetical protein
MDIGTSPGFDSRRCFPFLGVFSLEAAPSRAGSDLSCLFFFHCALAIGPDYDLNDDAKMYMSKRCFMIRIRDIGVGVYSLFVFIGCIRLTSYSGATIGLGWIHWWRY